MFYTYLIGWKNQRMFYYGVRYSKNAMVDDLWVTYKTSSKYVKIFYEENGDPDVIQVRKIHKSKESALLWESKVLRRLKVVEREDFLNRWDNNMVPINIEGPYPFEDTSVQEKVNSSLMKEYGGRGSAAPKIKHKIYETNIKKYGIHHTLDNPEVKNAREAACEKTYGEKNPFDNNEKLQQIMLERYGVTNMMFDDHVKQKHRHAMETIDWTLRNEKSKETNIKKYGTLCPMNRPEIRQKHKRSCPFGCKDNHLFDVGNFTHHMVKVHKWSKDQVKDYKDENRENTD
jgi:hypothetical protein